jgi:hypothetical protein
VTGHLPLLELPTRHFLTTENYYAAMPIILPDATQAIICRHTVTFDTLHEIEAVEQDQSGDPKALIVAPGNSHDGQKIVVIQTRSGGTHVNEGGYQTVGHMGLSSGNSFRCPPVVKCPLL